MQNVKLNNGFMPLYQRIKVLKSKDTGTKKTDEAKRLEKIGMVAPEQLKDHKQESTCGEIVAIGYSADESLKIGDFVTFGKYAGTEAADFEDKPEDGTKEYRYMNDEDLLSIQISQKEYANRYGEAA